MTSILTNSSATAALSILRGINASLGAEQGKISSGLRIQSAADNAAYWSIATTMKSETRSMAAVVDSIGLARGIVDTAYNAMETVHSSFVEIRNLAIIASQMPAPEFKNVVIGGFVIDEYYAKSDVARIEEQMQQFQNQARDAMLSASFAGVNLVHYNKNEPVKASELVHSFVIGYSEGMIQSLDINAMDVMLQNDDVGSFATAGPLDFNPEKGLFDTSDIVYAPGSLVPAGVYWYNIPLSNPVTMMPEAYDVNPSYVLMNLENNIVRNGGDRAGLYENFVAYVDTKLEGLTDRMTYLGSVQKSLAGFEDANETRIETATKGIGGLVDADMNESSARLRALETQQQLAVQALGIANDQPSRIMDLFR